MSGYILEWNDLECYGSKGSAFKNYKDYATPITRRVFKYASLIGAVLSICSLVMVMM